MGFLTGMTHHHDTVVAAGPFKQVQSTRGDSPGRKSSRHWQHLSISNPSLCFSPSQWNYLLRPKL